MRHEIAERLAVAIQELGMTHPYGGRVIQGSGGRTRDVLFSKSASLKGLVCVYSKKLIVVRCEGSLAPGGCWREGYASEADALSFLRAVAEGRVADAEGVPYKIRSAK